ncbi:MAG: hybrid sensor histidine kinase/response regulator [Polyangiaceae bacterium]|nr:hybrid sensor histidine kinase/response regulator [Polyangiaceae bacterium]
METDLGTILVVDDDRMSTMMLTRVLTSIGHSVTSASSGKAALELLDSKAFDVLILDCLMPEMDGYEVLEIVRGKPALKDLAIIMVSGVEDMASVVACLELGARDYLNKPFDPAVLRARIQNALAQKRSREREAKLYADLAANYEKLRELESLRDNLIHMIVHDLRVPLTNVIGGLDMLSTIASLDTDAKELLSLSHRGANTLLSLINDLLDVKRMESHALVFERRPVDLADVVNAACENVAFLATDEGVKLNKDAPAGSKVMGDAALLTRVVTNLLGNAVKFTPSGGEVTVRARPGPDGSMELEVRDTGEGIPEDALVHVFERFYQVRSKRGTRTNASGLGLTFCKMAIEAHGGIIFAESTLGVGSSFVFRLARA